MNQKMKALDRRVRDLGKRSQALIDDMWASPISRQAAIKQKQNSLIKLMKSEKKKLHAMDRHSHPYPKRFSDKAFNKYFSTYASPYESGRNYDYGESFLRDMPHLHLLIFDLQQSINELEHNMSSFKGGEKKIKGHMRRRRNPAAGPGPDAPLELAFQSNPRKRRNGGHDLPPLTLAGYAESNGLTLVPSDIPGFFRKMDKIQTSFRFGYGGANHEEGPYHSSLTDTEILYAGRGRQGVEVLREGRLFKVIPALFVRGYGRESWESDTAKYGATGYVVDPDRTSEKIDPDSVQMAERYRIRGPKGGFGLDPIKTYRSKKGMIKYVEHVLGGKPVSYELRYGRYLNNPRKRKNPTIAAGELRGIVSFLKKAEKEIRRIAGNKLESIKVSAAADRISLAHLDYEGQDSTDHDLKFSAWVLPNSPTIFDDQIHFFVDSPITGSYEEKITGNRSDMTYSVIVNYFAQVFGGSATSRQKRNPRKRKNPYESADMRQEFEKLFKAEMNKVVRGEGSVIWVEAYEPAKGGGWAVGFDTECAALKAYKHWTYHSNRFADDPFGYHTGISPNLGGWYLSYKPRPEPNPRKRKNHSPVAIAHDWPKTKVFDGKRYKLAGTFLTLSNAQNKRDAEKLVKMFHEDGKLARMATKTRGKTIFRAVYSGPKRKRRNPRKSMLPKEFGYYKIISDNAKETIYGSERYSCIIVVRHHSNHRPVLWECADGRHGTANSVPEAMSMAKPRR